MNSGNICFLVHLIQWAYILSDSTIEQLAIAY